MRRRLRTTAMGILGTLAAGAAWAQSPMEKALLAKSVDREIVLRLGADGKSLSVARDAGEFEPLRADQTFLSRGALRVAFSRFNPMRHLVTVGVTAADDPSHATIGSLVESLLGVVTTISPEAAKAATKRAVETAAFERADCSAEEGLAFALLDTLVDNLYAPAFSQAKIKAALADWSSAIDRGAEPGPWHGPSAIRRAVTAIDTYKKDEKLAALLANAEEAIKTLENRLKEGADGQCQAVARRWYLMMYLTNPAARLADIRKVSASIDELRNALNAYDSSAKWSPRGAEENYVLNDDIEPTRASMKVVSVKVSTVDYSKINALVPVVVSQTAEVASSSFRVQRHSFFLPEAAVGATFVRVPVEKFGTTPGPNGGTVVAEPKVDKTKVDPSLMVNFVCRCGVLGAITPMLQIGTSVSKEVPAILVGGGIRIFHAGKGDFAIGYGYVNAWSRQLKSLKPGDAAGTADIEKDLEYRRIEGFHHYIALQYKFTL